MPFDQSLDPLKWICYFPHVLEDDILPDGDGFIISCVPDAFLASKMGVKTAFRQISCIEDIVDGSVVISFNRKKLSGFLYNHGTGFRAFFLLSHSN